MRPEKPKRQILGLLVRVEKVYSFAMEKPSEKFLKQEMVSELKKEIDKLAEEYKQKRKQYRDCNERE